VYPDRQHIDVEGSLAALARLINVAHEDDNNEDLDCSICGCGFRIYIGMESVTVTRSAGSNSARILC
jgi:hypothetical protein